MTTRSVKAAEAEVVATSMRWYDYRERHTEMKQFNPGGDFHRIADDSVWDRLEAMEAQYEKACARLAALRPKKGKR
jgi:hypothetical protein